MKRYLFLLVAVPISAAPLYNITAIGGTVGPRTEAFSVNAHGAVAGTAIDLQGYSHGFVDDSLFAVDTEARDINDAGAIAGSRDGVATLWVGGLERNLGTLGGSSSAATSISNTGFVTGGAARSDGSIHAFLYRDGVMIDMGTLGGSASTGYGVNDAGQVVGSTFTARGYEKAFLWEAQNGMRDLGTIGGTRARALAVNAAGVAVGASTNAARYYHATLWDRSGGVVNLDTLGGSSSYAYDINGEGSVVGTSYDVQGRARAFLWIDGVLFDLNSLIDGTDDWTLTAAYGINDSGQIVGTGFHNGQSAAFRLDLNDVISISPSPSPADDIAVVSSVPEPATWCLLGWSLIAILYRRRRIPMS